MKTYFVPQGISADIIATEFGFSRDDCDALAVESQKRAAAAWAEDRFAKSIVPVRDVNGLPILDRDEHLRPGTDMQSLGALKPSFKDMGETMPGFDAVAILKYPHLERINHVHHAGNSSGIVDGAAAVLIGSEDFGDQARPEAARPHPRHRQDRHRPDDHADRPGPGDREDPARERHGRSATSTSSRSTRPSPPWCCASCRPSTSTPPASTSTAAPSPWATRSAPPAR